MNKPSKVEARCSLDLLTCALRRLEGLLEKGANNQTPSRVINIASVAGLSTGDPTAGGGGGLAAPGTGTYSCMYSLFHAVY
jgi:hypothetical protein